ncbi:DUF6802 family protein [Nocardia mexicana]|uniref:DUF6802 domain-containing protein n=1 Tax=Nocardia mexicana TaxID=279262 RepID=A0A370H6J9_9NOCA|nr:DUF6802 family protein [Nocardia mexicana]RDI51721.1 hypothetical protein DFR68_104205 [Nocardia mexicana]
MMTSDDLPGLNLPDVDAHSDLGGLGAVELHHPTQDIDADGIPDTESVAGPGGTDLWTDMDHDGTADHVTILDKDGEYSAWEFHQHPDGTSEWVRTDQGELGK